MTPLPLPPLPAAGDPPAVSVVPSAATSITGDARLRWAEQAAQALDQDKAAAQAAAVLNAIGKAVENGGAKPPQSAPPPPQAPPANGAQSEAAHAATPSAAISVTAAGTPGVAAQAPAAPAAPAAPPASGGQAGTEPEIVGDPWVSPPIISVNGRVGEQNTNNATGSSPAAAPPSFGAASVTQSIEDKLANPSPDDINTFYWIVGYFFAILVLWNFPVLKHVLYPFKLITVAFHEFSHAAAGKCTGARIEAITVNPDEGGVTRMRGGRTCCVLPAGYIGSSVIGAMMIFCGFNADASKACTAILLVCLAATLYWAETWFTRLLTLLFIAGLPLLWVLTPRALGLQHVVLFLGVMSACYSLWDIIEDLITRKVHSSDATLFAERYGGAPQFWGVFWFLISFLFLATAIVLALIVW